MPETGPAIAESKIVIRCRDYRASHDFYQNVLGFAVTEEWHEPGDVGCIFAPRGEDPMGCIEIYEMSEKDARYDPAFSQPLTSDKVDVQLRTPSLQAWMDRLQGRWDFSEPETTAWGHRWIKLRDPDNLLIAIYEVLT